MQIDIIAGARPNFMKIAPIIRAIAARAEHGVDIDYRLVHTGQHYDESLSGTFFKQLEIPNPDINLGVGSGSQAEQTGQIMLGYERALADCRPDLCLVVGDVTSTMACSIVAQKQGVPVAHVEAGIRSGDWSMPEEINRLVTDAVSNWFFATSRFACENLRNAGVESERIFLVGNTMIDTLIHQMPNFKTPNCWDKLALRARKYLMLTLHRPSNVDDPQKLHRLLARILSETSPLPVVFPAHPRTQATINVISGLSDRLNIIEPQPYLEFNYLVQNALGVITDSGGITEETTFMGIPCLTIRDTTERPETVEIGTNILGGNEPDGLGSHLRALAAGEWKTGGIPEYWDGKTAERIVSKIESIFSS